jgi:hypothetical protein
LRWERGGGLQKGGSDDCGLLELWLSLGQTRLQLPNPLAQLLDQLRLLGHPRAQALNHPAASTGFCVFL